jgi:hypothetical protein
VLTCGEGRLTLAEGVAMDLTNFGEVRRTAYLRPPATKGKKQERNMVVIVEPVVEGMAPILLRCDGIRPT